MSLTRKLKRQYERQTRKKDMVELYQHMDRATARLERNYKEAQIATLRATSTEGESDESSTED